MPAFVLCQPRAEWQFRKGDLIFKKHFLDKAEIVESKASIRFQAVKGKAEVAMPKTNPVALNTKAGDSWTFTLPVEGLKSGTTVDFWCILRTSDKEKTHLFMLEYLDGKKWIPALEEQEREGVKYNVETTTSPKWPARIWTSVTLKKAVKKGNVAFRLRQVSSETIAELMLDGAQSNSTTPKIVVYAPCEQRDSRSILFLGNSYSYYNLAPMLFKEIAFSQGHTAQCTFFYSGGYTMKAHLGNKYSRKAVEKGGYDCVMLQDQSVDPCFNGTEFDTGSQEYLGKMVEFVKKHSQNARQYLEITWGRRYGDNAMKERAKMTAKFPQWFSSYDQMQDRLIEVEKSEAEKLGIGVTPVGIAWKRVMRERPDLNLYYKDNHHPSYTGSYLKACVIYLTIYGERFSARVADAKMDPQTAQYLRSVAEKAVFDGE